MLGLGIKFSQKIQNTTFIHYSLKNLTVLRFGLYLTHGVVMAQIPSLSDYSNLNHFLLESKMRLNNQKLGCAR